MSPRTTTPASVVRARRQYEARHPERAGRFGRLQGATEPLPLEIRGPGSGKPMLQWPAGFDYKNHGGHLDPDPEPTKKAASSGPQRFPCPFDLNCRAPGGHPTFLQNDWVRHVLGSHFCRLRPNHPSVNGGSGEGIVPPIGGIWPLLDYPKFAQMTSKEAARCKRNGRWPRDGAAGMIQILADDGVLLA